jgi:hypothetical protein
MRVRARLRLLQSLQFVAIQNRTVCSYFQLVAVRCGLFGRTFNPKVAGSIPAPPTANRLKRRWPDAPFRGVTAGSGRGCEAAPSTRYGQLDVRVTVFDVMEMPGCTGVLTESAEVPVDVTE